jgi:hypothetical protein
MFLCTNTLFNPPVDPRGKPQDGLMCHTTKSGAINDFKDDFCGASDGGECRLRHLCTNCARIRHTSIEYWACCLYEPIEHWFEKAIIENMINFQIQFVGTLQGYSVKDLDTLGVLPSLEPSIMTRCYAEYLLLYPDSKQR